MRRLRFFLALVPGLVLALPACNDSAEPSTATTAELAVAAATPLSFRQLSAGDFHTCGVTTDDKAYCWGDGRLRPTPVSGGLRFLEVSAGRPDRFDDAITCGVTKELHAYCWGRDLVPSEVPGGRRFRQISVGLDYICGVNPFDVAFCWGRNDWNQLGTGGGFTTTPVRVAGGLRFRRVFTAATHTCGTTTTDRAYCWGWNNFGQLGVGSSATGISQPKPTAVAGGLLFQQVKPGSGYPTGLNSPEVEGPAYSCGVTKDERAYCWGGGSAPLGSTAGSSRTPIPVAGSRPFHFVHPGLWHACALTKFKTAFCWGSNEFGQLGTGTTSFSMTPARVTGGLQFESIAVPPTGWHGCGVAVDHRAYCWGRNSSGALGDGTNTNRLRPTAVAAPSQ
jgi:alpha-tubulin suppressor-like RCC1 family protein